MQKEWDDDDDGLPTRHLRPRYLCVLKDHIEECKWKKAEKLARKDGKRHQPQPSAPMLPSEFENILVRDWIEEYGENSDLKYIVVSYTRNHFQTASKEAMEQWQISDEERKRRIQLHPVDTKYLFLIAEKAARTAGVPAFYIDFECMDKVNQERTFIVFVMWYEERILL